MSAPIIVNVGWGNVLVNHDSATHDFKDAILEPTGCYEWNFMEGFNPEIDTKRTSHQYKKDMSKGIQPYSVRSLLKKGSVFILTTGFHDDLGVNKDTIKLLKNNKKEVIVVNSNDVANIYNDLVKKGKRVVALVHSTC